MKKCSPASFYMGTSWPWECAPELSPQKSFAQLLLERDEAIKQIRKPMCDRSFWRLVVDDINEILNRIRINEASLRPPVFARTNYT